MIDYTNKQKGNCGLGIVIAYIGKMRISNLRYALLVIKTEEILI